MTQLLQLVKFGAVGGVGVVVNFVVFNALWLTVFHPGRMPNGPMYATVVATLAAIVVNWLGNRYWAFADDRQANSGREALEFFAASLIGMLVPVGCLAFSQYVLGQHSLLSDNIATNVVGLLLGTALRFVLYKFWVYSPKRQAARAASSAVHAPVVDDVTTAVATQHADTRGIEITSA
jgi:putative flippase GtrA